MTKEPEKVEDLHSENVTITNCANLARIFENNWTRQTFM